MLAGHRAGTATNRKLEHPPFYPSRSDFQEVKTDAGHKGAWQYVFGTAAWGV